jgi:hypothetical protein
MAAYSDLHIPFGEMPDGRMIRVVLAGKPVCQVPMEQAGGK